MVYRQCAKLVDATINAAKSQALLNKTYARAVTLLKKEQAKPAPKAFETFKIEAAPVAKQALLKKN